MLGPTAPYKCSKVYWSTALPKSASFSTGPVSRCDCSSGQGSRTGGEDVHYEVACSSIRWVSTGLDVARA
eukprot:1512148-Rhodomonas_salina.2